MNNTNLDEYEQYISDFSESLDLDSLPKLSEEKKAELQLSASYTLTMNKLKEQSADTLNKFIKSKHWTQTQASEYFNVSQPRISDLQRKRIDLFRLDMLIKMLTVTNAKVKLTIESNTLT